MTSKDGNFVGNDVVDMSNDVLVALVKANRLGTTMALMST